MSPAPLCPAFLKLNVERALVWRYDPRRTEAAKRPMLINSASDIFAISARNCSTSKCLCTFPVPRRSPQEKPSENERAFGLFSVTCTRGSNGPVERAGGEAR
jgi:hypothetical protein